MGLQTHNIIRMYTAPAVTNMVWFHNWIVIYILGINSYLFSPPIWFIKTVVRPCSRSYLHRSYTVVQDIHCPWRCTVVSANRQLLRVIPILVSIDPLGNSQTMCSIDAQETMYTNVYMSRARCMKHGIMLTFLRIRYGFILTILFAMNPCLILTILWGIHTYNIVCYGFIPLFY